MGDVLTQRDGTTVEEESVALQNVTEANATDENATAMPLSHQFIYSAYAQGTSGVFVWAALIFTCFQVHTYCRLPIYMYRACTCKRGLQV